MRAWHFFWTIVVALARLLALFAGTLVSMFGSVIVIVGLAGWSISWLSAGAAIMLLGWWLFERFPSRRASSDAKSGERNADQTPVGPAGGR